VVSWKFGVFLQTVKQNNSVDQPSSPGKIQKTILSKKRETNYEAEKHLRQRKGKEPKRGTRKGEGEGPRGEGSWVLLLILALEREGLRSEEKAKRLSLQDLRKEGEVRAFCEVW